MNKIIEDTLKKNGKYDKQALTFFTSFVISVCLGVSNTIMSYILNVTENQTADSVFNAFMVLTGALSGVNVANKLVDSKVKQTEE
jgi:hypothetical protein